MISSRGAARGPVRQLQRDPFGVAEKRALNAAALGDPDATFPRTVRKVFKAITSSTTETTLVRIPWGPRLSVLFDPRGATNIVGGFLFVYGMAESTSIQLSKSPVLTSAAGEPIPFRVLEEAGCDGYIVTATLGTPLPAGTTQTIESFVYAATYAGVL